MSEERERAGTRGLVSSVGGQLLGRSVVYGICPASSMRCLPLSG